MPYRISKSPYLLRETVAMLFLYAQQKAPKRLRSQQNFPAGPETVRRNSQLSAIIRRVCADLDRNNPQLCYYFNKIETDNGFGDLCLAKFMTDSFETLNYPGFQESIDEIHEIWRNIRSSHVGIGSFDVAGLIFTQDASGDLFEHIASLELPAETRLELYRIFRNFDEELDKLAAFMAPYAERLDAELAQCGWMFDDLCAYWEDVFHNLDPLTFLKKVTACDISDSDASRVTLIALSMMNYREISYTIVSNSPFPLPHNLISIGSSITLESAVRRRVSSADEILSTMKVLCDRRRLDLLLRLGKKRSYCHELADETGQDPGNVSRNLSVLYGSGFLIQQREDLRCYYELNREALHNFFVMCEETLIGEPREKKSTEKPAKSRKKAKTSEASE